MYLFHDMEINRSSELFWNILLEIKKQFSSYPSELNLISAVFSREGFQLIPNLVPSDSIDQPALVVCLIKTDKFRINSAYIFVDEDFSIHVLYNDFLLENEIGFLRCYLGYCLMPQKAFRLKRTVSVLHLAQSLDGRIATLSGAAKWISNKENLVYVHRLRALCDGILIGSNTLHKDNPALTVRHVSGANPVKIVVGNSASNFESIRESNDRIIHIMSLPGSQENGIERISIKETAGYIHPVNLLNELYKQGISSVYIEGGATTASIFLRHGAIDIVNFFITPRILGSGISIEFPGALNIEDSLCLRNCRYIPMGDGMLVTGSF